MVIMKGLNKDIGTQLVHYDRIYVEESTSHMCFFLNECYPSTAEENKQNELFHWYQENGDRDIV